ncbi:hypothetical protein FRC04_009677 [Tulasnella sp. 424]|nr:hypothetical protein FRC04_009677 [Tulasnella sp. 424]
MLAEDRMKSSSSQFTEHLDELEAIQANAVEDILPAVLDELKADPKYEFNAQDVDASASEDDKEMAVKMWLEDWLDDLGASSRQGEEEVRADPSVARFMSVDLIGQIYRIHKKQHYDVLATLDAIHRTLVWRAKNLSNVPPPTEPSPFLRFLPHPLLNLDLTKGVNITTASTNAKGKGFSTAHLPKSFSENDAAGEKTTSPTTPRPPLPPRPPILFLSLKELTQYASTTTPTDTLEEKINAVKTMLIHVFEVARLYLRELDRKMKLSHKTDLKGKKTQRQTYEDEMEEEERNRTRLRMLQFVLMVDVQGAGMLPNLGADISRWVTEEVAPNYPGLCSAVFVVNYSWTYGALWAVIKRVLPQKVLSRISFPSGAELLQQFPPEFLLEEHGGTIPPFSPDYDPIMARFERRLRPTIFSDSASSTSTLVPGGGESDHGQSRASTPRPRTPKPRQATESTAAEEEEEETIDTFEPPPPVYLEPFSPHNPFYGYPTVVRYRPLPDGTFSAIPHLVHGRRRKRDLLKALAFLFVIQWRKKMGAWVQIVVNSMRATRTRVKTTARRNYLTFKTIGKILGLDTVGLFHTLPAGSMPAAVTITAVIIAAALVRIRRIREQQQSRTIDGRNGGSTMSADSGLLSVFRNPAEITWLLLRDVLLGGVGAGAAAGLGMLTPSIVLTMPATI